MKKTYLAPRTVAVSMMLLDGMLFGSRLVGGGPVNPEDDGPSVPENVSDGGDGGDGNSDGLSGGGGQGNNGEGNRAKVWDLWD